MKVICCLFLIIFVASACTPLRKKFIRKKKADNENLKFIPVLDPIDYPPKIYSSDERYKHHYSLWRIWNRDLLEVVKRKGSDKNQKYLMGQVLTHLKEMKKWIDQEKQDELDVVINDLIDIQKNYLKPAAMRNIISMRRKLELVAKKIRQGFNPKLITEHYK